MATAIETEKRAVGGARRPDSRVGGAPKWLGDIWLRPGYGVFQGAAGDNTRHAHCAHQIVIGPRGDVEVGFTQGAVRARGIAIPANIEHSLSSSAVLLIYLDPLTIEGRTLFHDSGETHKILPAPLCDLLQSAVRTDATLRHVLRTELGIAPPHATDARFDATMSALLESVTDCSAVNRAALAKLTGLSPGRFSHWFVEQAGLPLRRYRKWLRLVIALDHVSHSRNLTQAAHAAGFADSAHLSRTFRQMFGINPLAILQHVRWHGPGEAALS